MSLSQQELPSERKLANQRDSMRETNLSDFEQIEIETRRLKRKSRRRFWLILASIILLPIIAMLWLYYGESRRLWLIELNKLKQEGIPYDTLKMQKYYESLTVPSPEVQWVLGMAGEKKYRFLDPKFKAVPIHDRKEPAWDKPWPEPELTEEFLSFVEPLLQQFRSVKSFDEPYRFPFDWSDGILYGIDDFGMIRRFLCVKHAYALSKGDLEACLQCEADIRAMLPMVRNQPCITLLVIQNRFKSEHLRCIARRVEVGIGVTKDDLDLRTNDEIWNDLKAQIDLSLAGEICFFLMECNHRSRDSEDQLGIHRKDRIPFFITSNIDRRLGVLKLKEFQAIANNTSWRKGWQTAKEWLEDEFQRRSQRGVLSKFLCPWYSNDFPDCTGALRSSLESMQNIRLLNAAIGIRIYYDLNGRWPESLESLREIGIEPEWIESVGDVPFGYRIEQGGALLWGFDFDPRKPSPMPPKDLSFESAETRDFVYRIRVR